MKYCDILLLQYKDHKKKLALGVRRLSTSTGLHY